MSAADASPGSKASLFRAEEFLAWDEAVDAASRAEAERLLRERKEWVSRLEEQDFKLVPSAFGDHLHEPEALQRWRRKEHQTILKLIPAGKSKKFQKFREQWLREIAAARDAFPLLPNPPVSLQTTDNGQKMTVDLILGAPSTSFSLEIDEVKEKEHSVEVRATWVRPPLSSLVGKVPEPSQISQRVELTRKENLEVWVRTRDEDLPIRTNYQKLLAVPLGN